MINIVILFLFVLVILILIEIKADMILINKLENKYGYSCNCINLNRLPVQIVFSNYTRPSVYDILTKDVSDI